MGKQIDAGDEVERVDGAEAVPVAREDVVVFFERVRFGSGGDGGVTEFH